MDHVRQLLRACEHGDTHNVQELLDDGVGVDCADDDNEMTPLQVAAANGHDHIVRLLLMRGAVLDKPNSYGWTALMHASRNGHPMVVATLLQQGQADINAKNRLGATSLTLAARGGHIQVVRMLMESGIDLNSSGGCNQCDFTPLLAAAQHGHDAVLRFLLDRGCDVNYKTPSSGLTALMLASLNGHMKTAQILVESGCDPNYSNADNRTALDMALTRMKREVAAYLDRKTTNKPVRAPEEKKPDIIDAAKHGDIKRIKAILDQDLTQRDASSPEDGATPLMFAAMTGQLDISQFLVERGCDLDKQDKISGWTALMQATYHGKRAVAMYLIEKGADVTIQAKNGCTAFDMASLIDDVDTDLLRILAAKAMSVSKVKKHPSKQNGVPASVSSDNGVEDAPKSGLRGWLNRLSNRFRNMKKISVTNRLSPLPTTAAATEPTTPSSLSPPLPKRMNNFVDPVKPSTITSYETMTLENKQSASMYTLDINPSSSALTSETLKPVIPPFLPAPSYSFDSPIHGHKPLSARGSDTSSNIMSSPVRPMMRPMKFMPSKSTGNSILSSSPVSPSSSARFPNGNSSVNNPSPASSGDYQQNGLFWTSSQSQMNSSKVSSVPMPRQPRQFMPTKQSVPNAFKTASNTTSPNSSTSGSSSVTPQRSHGRSTSSKGSTTSTLTPSPSPTPGKYAEDPSRMLSSLHENDSTDELSGILKKLSLEKYQPIFEEQEVDMEAFLMLTDLDLKELGISQAHSRNQILTAITELNAGKGKERQQYVDTLTTFQTTLKARSQESGSSGDSPVNWINPDSVIPSAKSRYS